MLNPRQKSPVLVAVLAFDGISPFHLSVPFLVFDAHRDEQGRAGYDVRLCVAQTGAANRNVRTSAGFTVQAPHGLSLLARADMIIMPSWSDTLERPSEQLLAALRRAHRRGARIVGLCLGAFVVAEAGLLDGRSASTHWAMAAQFAQRFARVQLSQNVLYVDHGDVVTSAGTAAGIDCCLHLLRAQWGAELAARVARRLVVAPHRQGGQAQYIDHPLPVLASDTRLGQVLEWMALHLGEQLNLDQLARRALMSRRSFTRNFQKLTGSTVGQWLLHQRLGQAQRQLESSRRSIDDIALDTGFGSALVLRRHFARSLKTSPSAYRRAFQGQ